jgi:hypothetical protein
MSRLPAKLALVSVLAFPCLAAAADTDLGTLDKEALFGKRFRFSWKCGQEGGFNGIATVPPTFSCRSQVRWVNG